MAWVIRTNARCTKCLERHEYVTSNCMLVVCTHREMARDIAYTVAKEGNRVELAEIEQIPDVDVVIFEQLRGGVPNPALPRTSVSGSGI